LPGTWAVVGVETVEFPATEFLTPTVKPPSSINERTALTETGYVAFMEMNLLKLPVGLSLAVSR
jgi:hypothetical protein